VVIVTFLVTIPLLYFFYRSRLQIAERNRRYVIDLDARASIRDWDELRRTGPVLVATILAFFAHQALGIEPATVALTGAAVVLLVTKRSIEEALSNIEWPTLFFFLGLFVMVGALEATGAIGNVADAVKDLTGGDRSAELLGIVWVSGLGSGVVDNIPFTTAMIPVVEELQASGGAVGDDAYWWALALGACFGGNATIIAAAANVAAAGLTERAGRPIGFVAFLRVGLPVTILTLVIATCYIALRYILL
jgi:Na+/H+ antiporter NhaD/arsenite permease-like protein